MQNKNVRLWQGRGDTLLFPWIPSLILHDREQAQRVYHLHAWMCPVLGLGLDGRHLWTAHETHCGAVSPWQGWVLPCLTTPTPRPIIHYSPCPLPCFQASGRRWKEGTEEQGLGTWWVMPWVEVRLQPAGTGKEGPRLAGWSRHMGAWRGRWRACGRGGKRQEHVKLSSKPLPCSIVPSDITYKTNSKPKLLRISRWWLQSIKPQMQASFWVGRLAQDA